MSLRSRVWRLINESRIIKPAMQSLVIKDHTGRTISSSENLNSLLTHQGNAGPVHFVELRKIAPETSPYPYEMIVKYPDGSKATMVWKSIEDAGGWIYSRRIWRRANIDGIPEFVAIVRGQLKIDESATKSPFVVKKEWIAFRNIAKFIFEEFGHTPDQLTHEKNGSEIDEAIQNVAKVFGGSKAKREYIALLKYLPRPIEPLVTEELTKKNDAVDWIRDFQKSKDSRFDGDSKEKRRQRAIAAWYRKQKES